MGQGWHQLKEMAQTFSEKAKTPAHLVAGSMLARFCCSSEPDFQLNAHCSVLVAVMPQSRWDFSEATEASIE